jgi:hypothetical protein
MDVENNELLLNYHSFLLNDVETKKIEIKNNLINGLLFIYFGKEVYFIKLLYINIFNLGNNWDCTIICCYDNYEFIKNSCLEISENIKIIKVDKFENFLLNLNFWNDLKYENILLLDEKTLIFNNLDEEYFNYDIINDKNIIFIKKEIILKILNKSKISNLKNNDRTKIFVFYLFINKFLELMNYNKLLITEKTLIFKNEEEENNYCSNFFNKKSFSCLNIWLNNQNYYSIIQSKLQLKKKDGELEIILMSGYLSADIYKNYNVYSNFDVIKFNENQNYLFVNGDFDLNVENIRMLEKNFKESYCSIISPLIISNVGELEFFGGVFDNQKYIYIDNKIITLNKIENNEYWAKFIQNTMCPYFNLFMIKNVNNIFLKNEYVGFIENIINYSLILKEVKVTPFVKIKNRMSLNVSNEINLNIDNILPIKLNEKYLVDIYNQYNKNNLVSFKFFENKYLSLSNKKHILIIEYVKFSPENDCGSLYIYFLIKTLLKLGYQIHFYNIINDAKYNKIFQEMGIYVYESEKKIKNIINNYNVYDYVFISRVYSMNYLYEDVKKYCLKSKIIFITHDINLLKNKKQILYNKNIFYNPSVSDEMKYIDLSDISIIVSKYEFEFLKNEEKKEKIIYSPICYKIENDYNRCIENTHDIYFIGSGYHANVDAILFFLKNHWMYIISRINIKLHIIGKVCYNIGNEYKNNPSIVLHNCVPENKINDLLKKFRICIVPLRYGGGIKGKILQSFNLKIPCLASVIAVEGMEIIENENIIVEFFDNNFAEKFVNHYNNIKLLNKISENSYNLMKRVYSLEKNEEYINNIFKKL